MSCGLGVGVGARVGVFAGVVVAVGTGKGVAVTGGEGSGVGTAAGVVGVGGAGAGVAVTVGMTGKGIAVAVGAIGGGAGVGSNRSRVGTKSGGVAGMCGDKTRLVGGGGAPVKAGLIPKDAGGDGKAAGAVWDWVNTIAARKASSSKSTANPKQSHRRRAAQAHSRDWRNRRATAAAPLIRGGSQSLQKIGQGTSFLMGSLHIPDNHFAPADFVIAEY